MKWYYIVCIVLAVILVIEYIFIWFFKPGDIEKTDNYKWLLDKKAIIRSVETKLNEENKVICNGLLIEEFLKDNPDNVIFELKSIDKEKDIILCEEIVKVLKVYERNYAICSYNPKIIRWFKENNNTILRGQISFNYNKKFKDKKHSKLAGFLYNNNLTNYIGRPHFIIRERKDYNFTSKVCAMYMKVLLLVNDEKEELPNKVVNKILKGGNVDGADAK